MAKEKELKIPHRTSKCPELRAKGYSLGNFTMLESLLCGTLYTFCCLAKTEPLTMYDVSLYCKNEHGDVT